MFCRALLSIVRLLLFSSCVVLLLELKIYLKSEIDLEFLEYRVHY